MNCVTFGLSLTKSLHASHFLLNITFFFFFEIFVFKNDTLSLTGASEGSLNNISKYKYEFLMLHIESLKSYLKMLQVVAVI